MLHVDIHSESIQQKIKHQSSRLPQAQLTGSILFHFNPRAKHKRKPRARVANSTWLFTPWEKDSIANLKGRVILGWVVISLILKNLYT